MKRQQSDNLPAPLMVNKRSRMTATKRRILDALAEMAGDPLEYGTPPHSLAEVAHHMGADLSNTAKTLRLMERDGLVVREAANRPCWNAIAGDHMPRRCACYWLAATMQADKASAQAWQAGSARRSEEAFARMFGGPQQQPAKAGALVYDVEAKEVKAC